MLNDFQPIYYLESHLIGYYKVDLNHYICYSDKDRHIKIFWHYDEMVEHLINKYFETNKNG